MKENKMKMKWLKYIVITIIVCFAAFLLVGSYGRINEYFTAEPLYVDTNVSEIKINSTLHQGDKEFVIEKLEVGDEYSVLVFDSIEGGGMITGASLFQNGNELNYISAGATTYQGCAIAFEPADGLENIELRIMNITDIIEKEYVYPLIYDNDIAIVNVDINGDRGKITVTLSNDDISIDMEGLEKTFASQMLGHPIQPAQILLLKDGIEVEMHSSKEDTPDEIRIIAKEVKHDNDVIVIPIS